MEVRVTPKGVMDKDTDLLSVNQGNYIDANDIRMESVAGASAVAITNNKGNDEVISIPNTTAS